MKQLIVFDLDGTLAQSKASLDEEMATLLTDLLGVVQVAVISGGAWPQFHHDPALTGDAGTHQTIEVPCNAPSGGLAARRAQAWGRCGPVLGRTASTGSGSGARHQRRGFWSGAHSHLPASAARA